MIIQCRICKKLFKKSMMEFRVYEYDYDQGCCQQCNDSVDDIKPELI